MVSVEILGTLSSVIVAVSLTQKNIKLLRILNLIGAGGFAVYGYFIGSIPVLGLNSFIAVIDLYYYWTMIRYRSYFDQLEIEKPEESPYLRKFLDFHGDDIKLYQPSFDPEKISGCHGIYILRDMQPASVLLFREQGEGIIEMVLDYAVPAYRDYRNGEYFFREAVSRESEKKIREITAYSETGKHSSYLKHLGFIHERKEGNRDLYRLVREEK